MGTSDRPVTSALRLSGMYSSGGVWMVVRAVRFIQWLPSCAGAGSVDSRGSVDSVDSDEMLLLRIRLPQLSGAGAGSGDSAGSVVSPDLTGVGAASDTEEEGVSGSEGDEEATVEEAEAEETEVAIVGWGEAAAV